MSGIFREPGENYLMMICKQSCLLLEVGDLLLLNDFTDIRMSFLAPTGIPKMQMSFLKSQESYMYEALQSSTKPHPKHALQSARVWSSGSILIKE